MMDDVLAFYRGASQWAKDNIPKLVWPTEDTETEVIYKCVNIKETLNPSNISLWVLRTIAMDYFVLGF